MIDHLVFAGPNLADAVDYIAETLGEQPMPGGRHIGFGTANYLLGLGERCYLEVIGPDPDDLAFEGERPFGINALSEPKLVAWASERTGLTEFVARMRALGVELGEALPMSRETTDGQMLHWTLTLPQVNESGDPQLKPFFIDWGATAHPAVALGGGLAIEELRLSHAEHEAMQKVLENLELPVLVTEGETPALEAVIATANGPRTLS